MSIIDEMNRKFNKASSNNTIIPNIPTRQVQQIKQISNLVETQGLEKTRKIIQPIIPKNTQTKSNAKKNSLFDDFVNVYENIGTGIINGGLGFAQWLTSNAKNNINNTSKLFENKLTYKDSKGNIVTPKLPTSIIGNPIKENVLKNLDEFDKIVGSTIENKNIQVQKAVEKTSNPIVKKVAELAPSVGQMTPGIALTALNAPAGLTYFMGSAGGNYIQDAKQKGATDEQATVYGNALGAAEGLTEMLPFGALLKGTKQIAKSGIKSGIKALGLSVVENALQEAVMEPLTEVTSQAILGKSDWEDIPQRMLQSGIDGALVSMIMGGATAGLGKSVNVVNKITEGKKVTQLEIEAAVNESKALQINNISSNQNEFKTVLEDTKLQEVAKEKTKPLVMTREEYLSKNNGLFSENFGTHKTSNSVSKIQKEKMLNNFKEKAISEVELRDKLRNEYRQKLENGEIVSPSRIDTLISQANGHEDLKATQASRRILEKQGINWKQSKFTPVNDKIQNNQLIPTMTLPKVNTDTLINKVTSNVSMNNSVSKSTYKPLYTKEDIPNLLNESKTYQNATSRINEVKNKTQEILDMLEQESIDASNNKDIETFNKLNLEINNVTKVSQEEIARQNEIINNETTRVTEYVNSFKSQESNKSPIEEVKKQIPNISNVKESNKNLPQNKQALLQNNSNTINELIKYKNNTMRNIEKKILKKQEVLQNKNNKDTKVANLLKRQIITFNKQKNDIEVNYNKKIDNIYKKSENINSQVSNNILDTRSQVQEKIINETSLNNLNFDNAKNIHKLKMNLKTPERVVEATFDRQTAKELNDNFFYTVKQDTAEKIRFLNKERSEINSLGIKPGSKESAAVQKFGEKKFINEVGEYKNYTLLDLKAEFSNSWEKIKNAAEVIKNKYNNYIDSMNVVLNENGYDSIPKREDYMRHFEELKDLFSMVGIPNKVNELPTDINGITDDFLPGKNFFANAIARTGQKTTYDAIKGIDGYLEGAGNVIYHTKNIQKLRTLEKYIRQNYGKEALNNIGEMSKEDSANLIKKINESHLSNFASWLQEYTNNLAGKKARADRAVEDVIGRSAYKWLDLFKRQVGSNMTGFNIGSALTNFISGTQALAKTNKISFAKGTYDTIKNIFIRDNFINKSDFLTTRFGSEQLSKTIWQNISNVGQIAMTATDYFTANQVTRSKYHEFLQKGYSEKQAIKKADDFARRLMGGRGQGDMPNIFNSKALGLLTQFQLEVNNQIDSIFSDTFKYDYSEDSKSNLAKNNPKIYNAAVATFAFAQLLVFATLFNDEYEKIVGRRPAFDPIGVVKRAIKHYTNKELSTEEATSKVIEEIGQQLPFASTILDGGRIPLSSAIPDLKGIFTGEKDLNKEILKIPTYLLPPTGGGQAKKTLEGLNMFNKDASGSYSQSGRLRYPVEDTLDNKIQAGIFGQYSSKEAREYFDNNKLPYSEKQTELFNAGNRIGIKSNNIIDFINKTKEIDNDKSLEGKDGAKPQAKANYILKGSYTKKQKELLFNNIFTKEQNEKIDKEVKTTALSKLQLQQYHSTISNIVGDKDINYDIIEGSTQAKKALAIMNLNVSDSEKDKLLDLITTSKTPATVESLKNLKKDKQTYTDYFALNTKDLFVQEKISREDVQDIIDLEIDQGEFTKFYKGIDGIKADLDKNGKTIDGSKKKKIKQYINGLNVTIPQKAVLLGKAGYADKNYKQIVFNYINSKNISKERKLEIWNSLGYK